jgi:hypothetical protein
MAVEGEKGLKARAVEAFVEENPTKLGYPIVFTPSDDVLASDVARAKPFAEVARSAHDRALR